jgi:hypothetical protein
MKFSLQKYKINCSNIIYYLLCSFTQTLSFPGGCSLFSVLKSKMPSPASPVSPPERLMLGKHGEARHCVRRKFVPGAAGCEPSRANPQQDSKGGKTVMHKTSDQSSKIGHLLRSLGQRPFLHKLLLFKELHLISLLRFRTNTFLSQMRPIHSQVGLHLLPGAARLEIKIILPRPSLGIFLARQSS